MKRFLFTFILLSSIFFLHGQSLNYKPFFTVRIIDNENTEFVLSDMRYFDVNEELKYFFWIRRGSELGTASYQIDFKKIKSIVFISEYDNPIPNYTASQMTLTSGEVFDVLVNTTGSIGGMDNDFGIYSEIYMNYNIIQSIEFIHDGEYKKCPFCSALFYNKTYELCPFDKTELIDQN
ncbi:MAG: hypothetical protein PF518_05900 [Spirochaetaceae bacterium]|jgi:hypothetical protein|nr:hypothetical protein [Spirochaetaceae bacterium]